MVDIIGGHAPMDKLAFFIAEREQIRQRRLRGAAKPWTDDEVLRTYRFCNIYREADTETQWIAEHWRNPHKSDPEVWFAMVVARLVNWHETLEEIGYPVPFKPLRFIKTIQERRADGKKAFSGAYIVSTNGHRMDKSEYLVEHVLAPLWRDRKKLALHLMNWRVLFDTRLQKYHAALSQYNGMGSFMAAQVVADIKYTYWPVAECDDWWTFAASGPGSQRGLNRLMGRDVKSPWKEVDWRYHAEMWRGDINKMLRDKYYNQGLTIKLHGQDFQNCLCEFDKYMRVRNGEGRPRSLYPGV